jgi:hypothetical protein
MTWDATDLQKNVRQPASESLGSHDENDPSDSPYEAANAEPTEPFPQETPMMETLRELLGAEERGWVPTLLERKRMKQIGMIPDDEWPRIRKLMTRGIAPLW